MKAEYIDHLGDDLTVCNAARVSFDKISDWEWGPYCDQCGDSHGPYLPEKDKKLIHYLAKHNHFTPFTHCVITLRETVPIFVARQRFKHTVGFTYNEVSRRYVDDTPEFYFPEEWRGKPEGSMKQGSSDKVIGPTATPFHLDYDDGEYFIGDMYIGQYHNICLRMYESMLKKGVAPEQARMVLPQSMMTEYYTTGSLAAWARAYKLRIDNHAQKEIQDLAKMWNTEISKLEGLKYSWQALTS